MADRVAGDCDAFSSARAQRTCSGRQGRCQRRSFVPLLGDWWETDDLEQVFVDAAGDLDLDG
jgi:hypothetical protein